MLLDSIRKYINKGYEITFKNEAIQGSKQEVLNISFKQDDDDYEDNYSFDTNCTLSSLSNDCDEDINGCMEELDYLFFGEQFTVKVKDLASKIMTNEIIEKYLIKENIETYAKLDIEDEINLYIKKQDVKKLFKGELFETLSRSNITFPWLNKISDDFIADKVYSDKTFQNRTYKYEKETL